MNNVDDRRTILIMRIGTVANMIGAHELTYSMRLAVFYMAELKLASDFEGVMMQLNR